MGVMEERKCSKILCEWRKSDRTGSWPVQVTLSKGNGLQAGGLGGSMGRRNAGFIASIHKFFKEFTTAVISVNHWML